MGFVRNALLSGIKHSTCILKKLQSSQHLSNGFFRRDSLCSPNFMEAYGELVIINVKCLSGNLNGLFRSLLK